VLRYRGDQPDKAHAPVDTGVAGLLTRAYSVDAGVDAVIVRPINALAGSVFARGVEPGVDRTMSGGGTLLAWTASVFGSRFQDGDVGKYAWLIAAGALVVIAALSLS